MTPSKLDRYFGHRLRKLLEGVLVKAKESGYRVVWEPAERGSGEPGLHYEATVRAPSDQSEIDPMDPKNSDLGITVELMFSEDADGTEGGLNFSMGVCTVGGEIVSGFTPYNYTDDVWVKRSDDDAIKVRWNLFRNGVEDVDQDTYFGDRK